jgi:O-antigen ligase
MKIYIPIYLALNLVILTIFQLGQLGTLVLIPFTFLYIVFAKYNNFPKIFKSGPIKLYASFVFFGFLSLFYAIDLELALKTQLRVLIVMFFALSIYSYIIESIKNLRVVLFTNFLICIGLFIYVFLNRDMASVDRFDEGVLNSNTYGYIAYISLTSLFFLYTLTNNNKKVLSALILMIPASIYLTLITSSRGGFFCVSIIIVGNLFLLINKSYIKKHLIKRISIRILAIIFIYLGLNYFYQEIYTGSNISLRFEQLNEIETPREFHFKKAIEIANENLILGIGAGNYSIIPKHTEMGSFSHNSFTEAWVSYGIFGLALYLITLFLVLRNIIKGIKHSYFKRKIISYQLLISFFVFIIYNSLYVVYLDSLFMMYLLILIALTYYTQTNKFNE